jgi:hypothetical protein
MKHSGYDNMVRMQTRMGFIPVAYLLHMIAFSFRAWPRSGAQTYANHVTTYTNTMQGKWLSCSYYVDTYLVSAPYLLPLRELL